MTSQGLVSSPFAIARQDDLESLPEVSQDGIVPLLVGMWEHASLAYEMLKRDVERLQTRDVAIAQDVAAAADVDLSGYLLAANDLSDIGSAFSARSNLGLGTTDDVTHNTISLSSASAYSTLIDTSAFSIKTRYNNVASADNLAGLYFKSEAASVSESGSTKYARIAWHNYSSFSPTEYFDVISNRPVTIQSTYWTSDSISLGGTSSAGGVTIASATKVSITSTCEIAANVEIGASGSTVGFFGATGTTQVATSAVSAVTTTGTAGATYTATERGMINSLFTDVINLQYVLNQINVALKGYSLVS